MSSDAAGPERTLDAIAAWERAQPVLETGRLRHIREADPRRFIRYFAGMVEAVMARDGLRACSGLVEMQRLFRTVPR